MNYTYPQNIARFYDTIYHQVRDSVDNDYFLNEILKVQGKVLEAGVGTGRLFMNALNHGADIYGIDISARMLEILYKKLPADEHFRISRQNIVDFSLEPEFDLIIAPFRVLMHLTEKEDQLSALDTVSRHLQSKGRFLFDVFVPDPAQLVAGRKNQLDFEGEYAPGKKVRRIVSTSPDLINQLIHVSFHMEWEEDGEWKHDDWTFPMRFYFRYELEHLLGRSRFESYEIYGDYKGSRLDRNSKEFVVICTMK